MLRYLRLRLEARRLAWRYAAAVAALRPMMRPTSRRVAPNTSSDRTKASIETVTSAASILATRDWLDPRFFGQFFLCQTVRRAAVFQAARQRQFHLDQCRVLVAQSKKSLGGCQFPAGFFQSVSLQLFHTSLSSGVVIRLQPGFALRRTADGNLPAYKHDAPASEPETHLLALRAGMRSTAARLIASLTLAPRQSVLGRMLY